MADKPFEAAISGVYLLENDGTIKWKEFLYPVSSIFDQKDSVANSNRGKLEVTTGTAGVGADDCPRSRNEDLKEKKKDHKSLGEWGGFGRIIFSGKTYRYVCEKNNCTETYWKEENCHRSKDTCVKWVN